MRSAARWITASMSAASPARPSRHRGCRRARSGTRGILQRLLDVRHRAARPGCRGSRSAPARWSRSSRSIVAEPIRPAPPVTRMSCAVDVHRVSLSLSGLARAVAAQRRPRTVAARMLQVQPKRAVADVAQVHAHHLVEADAAAPLDLPQPREPGLDAEDAAQVPGLVVRRLVGDRRPRARPGSCRPSAR